MSLRKSSNSRNGSKSDVLPKPKARRRCTPAPSRVGLDLITRFMCRRDILRSNKFWNHSLRKQVELPLAVLEFHKRGYHQTAGCQNARKLQRARRTLPPWRKRRCKHISWGFRSCSVEESV